MDNSIQIRCSVSHPTKILEKRCFRSLKSYFSASTDQIEIFVKIETFVNSNLKITMRTGSRFHRLPKLPKLTNYYTLVGGQCQRSIYKNFL